MQTKEKNIAYELQEMLNNYESECENLIPALQGVQKKFGYISEEAVAGISRHFNVSQSEIYGIATFYTQFRFVQPGEHMVKICLGTACHVRGGSQIMDEIGRKLGIKAGETTTDKKFSAERVACFGSCALAPVMVVDEKVYGRVTQMKVKKILKEFG